MRILSCGSCATAEPVPDDEATACPRCGSTTWIDFPHLEAGGWPDDIPDEWPAHPAAGQTLAAISTLWRYDGTEWVPVARRPRGLHR